jgi:ubiquinone/menaquinone biosynthesis C-methylase UbiE
MLERVLEQEVMDSEQDAQEYETFDNSAVNEQFVARALELAPVTGTVLDMGTGPGDIAILLAQRASGLRIVAIDLGEHMLAAARAKVRRAGLSDRIEITRADVKSTGLTRASFDMVISNSLVHHIPEPESFFAEMKRLARPDAAFFIKDLHRPATEGEHHRLVDTYAKGCTPYQRQTFSDSLRAGLIVSEVQAICARLDLPGLNVCRSSDRHWCAERRSGMSGRAAPRD